jgi:plasmid maintenance system killer protein
MIKLIFRYEELKKLYEDKNYRHRKMPYEIQVGYARKCRILEFMNSVQDLRGMK